MRFILFIIVLLTINSCGSNNSESSNSSIENDDIIACYEEMFENEDMDYHENLARTIEGMNELDFPINGGKKEDLIEVLTSMKKGSFPKDSPMESEAVYSRLKIMSIEACVFKYRHDPEYAKTISELDNIVVYDVHNKVEFDEMVQNTIDQLNTFESLPVWTEPFAIHLSTLFYTQYWRVNHQNTMDHEENEVDTTVSYPPPPIEPPPPPVIEVIEIEDEEEEELPEPATYLDSL